MKILQGNDSDRFWEMENTGISEFEIWNNVLLQIYSANTKLSRLHLAKHRAYKWKNLYVSLRNSSNEINKECYCNLLDGY